MLATTLEQDHLANMVNAIDYMVNQLLLNINTLLPCKITAISDDKLYCDVIPLINALDVNGKPFQSTTLYNLPIIQITGGSCGIITEYDVGDTVAVIFCQRDLTNISINWQQGNPVSFRKFNLADGIVLYNLSITKPTTTFIKITKDGIIIQSDKDVVTNCKNATITATENITATCQALSVTANTTVTVQSTGATNITSSGALTLTGSTVAIDGTLSINGSPYLSHAHKVENVQTGGSTIPTTGVS
jgi:hypothetical protein